MSDETTTPEGDLSRTSEYVFVDEVPPVRRTRRKEPSAMDPKDADAGTQDGRGF